MNKTIEYLLIFASGILLGALSTRNYYKNEYEKRADEEIESVKATYSRSKPAQNEEKEEKTEEKVTENTPHIESVPPKIVNLYRGEVDHDAEVDYGKYYSSQERRDDDVKVYMEAQDPAEKEFPREEDGPMIIDATTYDSTEPGFDKMSCTLYVPNMTVVDDTSREVVDDDILGIDNLAYLANSGATLGYIRNTSISCDMEIAIVDESIEESGILA